MSSDPEFDETAGEVLPVTAPDRRRWWLSIRGIMTLWIIAIVLAVIVLFVADNFVLVEVRLMQLRIQARLAWVVILAFVGGALVGLIVGRLSAKPLVFRWRRGEGTTQGAQAAGQKGTTLDTTPGARRPAGR
jgi:uncharacterized integral membrane protein